jgi:hypothetical protein
MKLKTLLRAENAADLRLKVDTSIGNGHDIHSNIFIDPGTGLLCQWMSPRHSRYEYRLIEAGDLESFEMHVHSLTVMGFDFLFSTVVWDGKLLQWMHRFYADQQFVVNTVGASLLDNGEVASDLQANELKLVEGVQVALRMAPVDFLFSSSAPFPLVR